MPIGECIGDDRAVSLRLASCKALGYGGCAGLDSGEWQTADTLPALTSQHTHEIRIMHRIERVMAQRAFAEQAISDEQMTLIDTPPRSGGKRGRR